MKIVYIHRIGDRDAKRNNDPIIVLHSDDEFILNIYDGIDRYRVKCPNSCTDLGHSG